MKERTAIVASIYYLNEDGKERVKQLYMNDKDTFFSCLEAFSPVIHVTRLRLVEMYYAPAGRNTRNVTEWYTINNNKPIMTRRYED